ncbi:hypothetical protein CAPTEDRAFT_228397 [Capitella teleta]|uniref:Phospholipid scramblase n=1 Tax=Capitella teleta TaxID=283909 RepID=R7UTS5_CAPTE|nr:hypothetical protein CAPTEDRAFT_228397 [Capitella teleta]|eukprot:ELU07337.1 hypothetical protein CAPTEDRAFT_228397 [Capitella teleta]
MATVVKQPKSVAFQLDFSSDTDHPGGLTKESALFTPSPLEGQTRETTPPETITGLEELEDEEVIHIRQSIANDIKGGCGSGNSYQVLNRNDDVIFTVEEDDAPWCRWLCGPNRSFHLVIYNRSERPVLHVDRAGCRCECCCCFDACLCQNKLLVRDVSGKVIGAVRERFHALHPKFDIYDELNNALHRISGPCCSFRCCPEVNFDIRTRNNKINKGYIFKQHNHFDESVNTDHDNIEIKIPGGLTLSQKGTLIGASFLVSLMYFEMS